MKTLRLVVGIISVVLCFVIIFQSCAVGIGNALTENNETSGMSGFMTAIFMAIGGIIGMAGRKSNGATITAAIFFLIGGISGTTGFGSFTDLQIWGILNLIFCGLYIVSVIFTRKQKKAEEVKE